MIINYIDIRTSANNINSIAESFLSYRYCFQIIVWFLIIILLKFDNILEPPIWDSAMGVFPAAVYLHESGFNYQDLLQQSGWWQGGPNVHSFSLLPLLVAIVFTFTESTPIAFFIIHCFIFLIVAWALTAFTRTIKSYCKDSLAVIISTIAILLMPIVLVQVGYMYEEILVLAFNIVAWSSWKEGRLKRTIFFCFISIAFKLTGIAIIICIVLSIFINKRLLDIKHAALALLLGIISAGFVFLPNYLYNSPDGLSAWQHDSLLSSALARLLSVPDLLILLYIGIRSGVIYLWSPLTVNANDNVSAYSQSSDPLLDVYFNAGLSVCFLMPLVFIAGVLYQVTNDMLFLPRYLIPLIPFAIGSYLIQGYYNGLVRKRLIFFVVFIFISIINTNGLLYSNNNTSFSVVERSHAYKKFNQLQVELVDHLTTAYNDVPIYVSREIWYMTSHPRLGYVNGKIDNIMPIFRDDLKSIRLKSYPEEFVLVLSNYSHGGELITAVAQEALNSRDYAVDTKKFRVDNFEGLVFKVSRLHARD